MSSSRATSHTMFAHSHGSADRRTRQGFGASLQVPPPGRDHPLGSGRGADICLSHEAAALLPQLEACGPVKC